MIHNYQHGPVKLICSVSNEGHLDMFYHKVVFFWGGGLNIYGYVRIKIIGVGDKLIQINCPQM